jgi:hypothetical protein
MSPDRADRRQLGEVVSRVRLGGERFTADSLKGLGKLLEVNGVELTVRGLDAIDGSRCSTSSPT